MTPTPSITVNKPRPVATARHYAWLAVGVGFTVVAWGGIALAWWRMKP